MARVELIDVHHRYADGPPVLQAVDLAIADGGAHALLGPSGTGKSTLLNVLSGLVVPTRGRVLLDGVDVTARRPRDRGIAQVFQFPVLYPALTVAGNLAFALQARRVPRAEASARVARIVDALGLGDLLDRRPAELSPYDAQKVALGRALVRSDVGLILLDEPLTAVEPAERWRLRRVLRDVQHELGVTMLYVTHDQLEALTFADQVSVMDGGRIVQTADPATLIDAPAHRFVGTFIGAPGMNVLPAGAAAGLPGLGAAADEYGFRPEWAHIALAGGRGALPVTVEAVQVSGVQGGVAQGVVSARLAGHPVWTRQAVAGLAPGPGWLQVERAVLFADGRRVDG